MRKAEGKNIRNWAKKWGMRKRHELCKKRGTGSVFKKKKYMFV